MSVLSAIARGEEGQALLTFAREHELAPDWHEPREVGVRAMVSGNNLDNRHGCDLVVGGALNRELVVHLDGPRGTCAVNMATMLALATAYVNAELERAQQVIDKKTEHQD